MRKQTVAERTASLTKYTNARGRENERKNAREISSLGSVNRDCFTVSATSTFIGERKANRRVLPPRPQEVKTRQTRSCGETAAVWRRVQRIERDGKKPRICEPYDRGKFYRPYIHVAEAKQTYITYAIYNDIRRIRIDTKYSRIANCAFNSETQRLMRIIVAKRYGP